MMVREIKMQTSHYSNTFFSLQATHAVEFGLLGSLVFLSSVAVQSQVLFPLWHWEHTGFSSSHLTYHVSNCGSRQPARNNFTFLDLHVRHPVRVRWIIVLVIARDLS